MLFSTLVVETGLYNKVLQTVCRDALVGPCSTLVYRQLDLKQYLTLIISSTINYIVKVFDQQYFANNNIIKILPLLL